MGHEGLVKTELLCNTLWDKRRQIVYMPPVYIEDKIHLSFTIPDIGKIEGLFVVEDHLHIVDTGTGYKQRLHLEPHDP